MALILNIESATALCSVALAKDGKVLSLRETLEERSHASRLSVFIQEILKENNLMVSQLDAVAVGKGPGSYTGLRIGVSTAKGLCYGSGKPLIAAGTLQIMYEGVLTGNPLDKISPDRNVLFCPMIDARRMEVFTCILDAHGKEVLPVEAKIIDENTFSDFLLNNTMIFFGSGMEKCKDVLKNKNAIFLDGIHPSSSALAVIAEQRFNESLFENTAYFEPFYLKDFIATVSKKGLYS